MDDGDSQLYHNGDGRGRGRGAGMAAPQTQYPSAAFPQTQYHGAAYPQPFQGGGYGFGHHPMTDGGQFYHYGGGGMAPPQI